MRRELIATVGKNEVEVVVDANDGGRWRVVIDGREHMVDAVRIRPGTWSLLVEGRSYVVDLDRRKRGTTASDGARSTAIAIDDARQKRLAEVAGAAAGGATGEVVKAPIAGKVVKLLVAAGDQVAAGQGVAVLEAMKMENEIKADRGGAVSALHVEPGQSVETSDKLVTLE